MGSDIGVDPAGGPCPYGVGTQRLRRGTAPNDARNHRVLGTFPTALPCDMQDGLPPPEGVFSFFSPDFTQAFAASLSVIVVSELGDKTFFIAAILAMRHPRTVIFSGAIAALGLMTVLSCIMGHALPSMLPKTYTHYAAAALFFVFGLRLLRDVRVARLQDGVYSCMA